MLGDGEIAPGEGDVVIGGKEGDQSKGDATTGLGHTKPIEPKRADATPGEQGFC